MNQKIIISFLVYLTIFIISCTEDPRKLAERELQKTMEPTRRELERYKSQSIFWENGSTDKDTCIKNFLEGIKKESIDLICAVDDREWKESYLPYVYGTGTILDGTPLKQYNEITKQRQEIGIEKIKILLAKKKYQIKSINWLKNNKSNFGPFQGWKPVITLSINRNTFVINEIKQVVEYKAMYKIAVIAP